LDYRSRRDLEKILGDLEHDRREEREQGRGERIRRAANVYAFEQADAAVLRPALREVMERLERHGHHARLVVPRATKLRLELVLQASHPVNARIEIELDDDAGVVHVRGERQHRAVGACALPVRELVESRVAAALVQVLRAVTEAPAPARGARR